MVQQVRNNLAALLPGSDSKTAQCLQKAQDAVKELGNLKNPPVAVTTARNTLVTSSRAVAQLALDEAVAGHGAAGKITKAQTKLVKGDSEVSKGKLDKAIAEYEDAREYAQQALGLPVASSLLTEDQPEAPAAPDAADETTADPVGALVNRAFLPLVSR